MRKSTYILFTCLLLEGCLATKPPNKVNNLLVLPVLSDIGILYNGDSVKKDSILSEKVATQYSALISTYVPENIARTEYKAKKDEIEEIRKAFIYIAEMSEPQESERKITTIPKILLRILNESSSEFGLGLISTGFIRTNDNQIKQYTISRGVHFFTLGAINYVPNESFSTLICFIIDKKNKRLHYYKSIRERERNPTDLFVIKSQIRYLLASYFLKEK